MSSVFWCKKALLHRTYFFLAVVQRDRDAIPLQLWPADKFTGKKTCANVHVANICIYSIAFIVFITGTLYMHLDLSAVCVFRCVLVSERKRSGTEKDKKGGGKERGREGKGGGEQEKGIE